VEQRRQQRIEGVEEGVDAPEMMELLPQRAGRADGAIVVDHVVEVADRRGHEPLQHALGRGIDHRLQAGVVEHQRVVPVRGVHAGHVEREVGVHAAEQRACHAGGLALALGRPRGHAGETSAVLRRVVHGGDDIIGELLGSSGDVHVGHRDHAGQFAHPRDPGIPGARRHRHVHALPEQHPVEGGQVWGGADVLSDRALGAALVPGKLVHACERFEPVVLVFDGIQDDRAAVRDQVRQDRFVERREIGAHPFQIIRVVRAEVHQAVGCHGLLGGGRDQPGRHPAAVHLVADVRPRAEIDVEPMGPAGGQEGHQVREIEAAGLGLDHVPGHIDIHRVEARGGELAQPVVPFAPGQAEPLQRAPAQRAVLAVEDEPLGTDLDAAEGGRREVVGRAAVRSRPRVVGRRLVLPAGGVGVVEGPRRRVVTGGEEPRKKKEKKKKKIITTEHTEHERQVEKAWLRLPQGASATDHSRIAPEGFSTPLPTSTFRVFRVIRGELFPLPSSFFSPNPGLFALARAGALPAVDAPGAVDLAQHQQHGAGGVQRDACDLPRP